jgi:hypothetical protein
MDGDKLWIGLQAVDKQIMHVTDRLKLLNITPYQPNSKEQGSNSRYWPHEPFFLINRSNP